MNQSVLWILSVGLILVGSYALGAALESFNSPEGSPAPWRGRLRRVVGGAWPWALALLACGTPQAPAVHEGGMVLPFIENDYQKAIVQAKEASHPIFVEVWAPW